MSSMYAGIPRVRSAFKKAYRRVTLERLMNCFSRILAESMWVVNRFRTGLVSIGSFNLSFEKVFV